MDNVAEKPESEQPVAAEGDAPGAAGEAVAETAAEAPRPEAGAERPAPSPSAEAEREPAPRPERKRRGRYTPRRKVCAFCVDKVEIIDYKDPSKLRRYLSDRGKMEPRRKTGTCAKHQRRLSIALKRARHLALLPYTAEHIRLTGVFAPRSYPPRPGQGGSRPIEHGSAGPPP
jgi:small subunit ribosomal protein S18